MELKTGIAAKSATGLPLTPDQTEGLFYFLARMLDQDAPIGGPPGCSGALEETRFFLDAEGITGPRQAEIVTWLREHDGYCDCEVLYNVLLLDGRESPEYLHAV